MTHGDLFAGIGGFALAAQRCGIQTKWMVEIDEFCRKVYAKHFPEVKQYSDIKEVREIEYVDIITGGFPCQPVSCAGRRQGQSDPRWLWPEFARVIALVRPKYVLVENVPGLLHQGMGDILIDLASCGYDAEWDCILASAVGAPHRRDRVWIVAYSASLFSDGSYNNPRICLEEKSFFKFRDCCRSKDVADATQRGLSTSMSLGQSSGTRHAANSSWWTTEPNVGRVAHGVPARVDRLRCLGNAIVPQVATKILNAILSVEKEEE